MLGLSYRAVETFLLVFGRKGSKSSVERDVAQAGQKARALHTQAPAMRVRILGVDGIGAKMAGQNAGLLFYVDIERQQLLCVEPVKETDTQRIRRHVRRMWKANLLLQHIERTWSRVSRDPCDANNNTTERGIGLTYKIRSKTMRGFKNWDKELAHPYLAQFK